MKRRSPLLLLVALTLLATACSSSSGNPDAAPREPSTSSSTTTTRLVLRPAAPYRPIAGEPVPELKPMAADALQAIAIYDVGGGPVEAVPRRPAGQTVRLDVEAAVAPVLGEHALPTRRDVPPHIGGRQDT